MHFDKKRGTRPAYNDGLKCRVTAMPGFLKNHIYSDCEPWPVVCRTGPVVWLYQEHFFEDVVEGVLEVVGFFHDGDVRQVQAAEVHHVGAAVVDADI